MGRRQNGQKAFITVQELTTGHESWLVQHLRMHPGIDAAKLKHDFERRFHKTVSGNGAFHQYSLELAKKENEKQEAQEV